MLFINTEPYSKCEQRKSKRVSASFISKASFKLIYPETLPPLEAPQKTQSPIIISSKVSKIQIMDLIIYMSYSPIVTKVLMYS